MIEKANLKLKAEKYVFFKSNLPLLGHINDKKE